MRLKPLRTNSLVWPVSTWLVCAAAVFAADGAKPALKIRPAADYAHHQSSENVTVAVQPYETDEQAKEAFGKNNPWRLGIFPVLLVIQNDGKDALRVEKMRLDYVLPDGAKVENTPAANVKYIHGDASPKSVPGPFGGIAVSRTPKNPLAEWEIQGRAFAAQMIPEASASGSVYSGAADQRRRFSLSLRPRTRSPGKPFTTSKYLSPANRDHPG